MPRAALRETPEARLAFCARGPLVVHQKPSISAAFLLEAFSSQTVPGVEFRQSGHKLLGRRPESARASRPPEMAGAPPAPNSAPSSWKHSASGQKSLETSPIVAANEQRRCHSNRAGLRQLAWSTTSARPWRSECLLRGRLSRFRKKWIAPCSYSLVALPMASPRNLSARSLKIFFSLASRSSFSPFP
jgi:hypothetical protein